MIELKYMTVIQVKQMNAFILFLLIISTVSIVKLIVKLVNYSILANSLILGIKLNIL